jgi:hypothetical protein
MLSRARQLAEGARFGHLLASTWLLEGQVRFIRYDLGKAVPTLEKALSLLEETGDAAAIAMAHMALAETFSFLRDDDAVAIHQIASIGAARRGGVSNGNLLVSLSVSAEKSRRLGELRSALYFVDEALAELSARPNDFELAYLTLERSRINERIGRTDMALEDLARSKAYCDKVSDATAVSGIRVGIAIEESRRCATMPSTRHSGGRSISIVDRPTFDSATWIALRPILRARSER